MSSDLISALAAALGSDEPQPVATKVRMWRSLVIAFTGVQIREGALDEDTIIEYLDRYANGKEMPALGVWKLKDYPELGEQRVISAGFQRIEAQDRLHGGGNGQPPIDDYEIEVDVYEGNLSDAILHAGTSNLNHGRPLTRRERELAVVRYLRLTQYSYSRIAKIFGTAVSTISDIDKRNGVRVPLASLGKPNDSAAPASSDTPASASDAPGVEDNDEYITVVRRGTAYRQRKPAGRKRKEQESAGSASGSAPATPEPAAPPPPVPVTSTPSAATPEPAAPPVTAPDTFIANAPEPAQATPVNLPPHNLVLPAPSTAASELTPAVALEILAQTHDVATWLGATDKEIGYELYRIANLAAGLIERMQR